MFAPQLQQSISDYPKAEAFLLSLVRPVPRPYGSHALEGVRSLLEALGNPQLDLHCVHIAGSKGKGSVALMSEALFESHDIHTATFTSPHLRRWTERFRIGGKEISLQVFLNALERIRLILQTVAANSTADLPSFFDVLSATALLLFHEARVELAIIECGLGGRYDATNIITPELCCITSIELEHVDKLGSTIASIAAHKAGIIKPEIPVVCGPLPPAAFAVIEPEARDLQAPLFRAGWDFTIEAIATAEELQTDQQRLRYTRRGAVVEFQLPCYGWHMAENVAQALTMLDLYGQHHPHTSAIRIDSTRTTECLAGLNLPGRGQVISRDPLIVIDAAHTPQSLALLGQHLDALQGGSRCFLISATYSKNLQALAELLASAEQVYITRVDPLRSMPAIELAAGLAQYCPQLKMHIIEDPVAALDAVYKNLNPQQMLCVCGSVYLAGFALDHLADATYRCAVSNSQRYR